MKFCGKCKVTKDDASFNKRRGGLQPNCRECQNAYSASHYLSNKPAYFGRAKKSRSIALQELNEIKNVPCQDCKGRFHPVAMDFDHVGEKLFDIARGYRAKARSAVMAEIAKCEIVCSNCHRVRTFNRLKLPSSTSVTECHPPCRVVSKPIGRVAERQCDGLLGFDSRPCNHT